MFLAGLWRMQQLENYSLVNLNEHKTVTWMEPRALEIYVNAAWHGVYGIAHRQQATATQHHSLGIVSMCATWTLFLSSRESSLHLIHVISLFACDHRTLRTTQNPNIYAKDKKNRKIKYTKRKTAFGNLRQWFCCRRNQHESHQNTNI